MLNSWWLAATVTATTGECLLEALVVNVSTGPFVTGWIMLVLLLVMAWFGAEKRRRKTFERFFYSHHLWVPWSVGGVVYIAERVLREVRSRHRTYLSKVIVHPGKTVELQIKKEKTATRAGQYIMLNCPAVSLWQWHPFTLTSAPEEDHLSVHFQGFNPEVNQGE
ncbi:hypothetical protein JCM10449v2_004073 [Rhodotorula kratochvilovae]